MTKITYSELIRDIEELAGKIDRKYRAVFGVPKGGAIVATHLSYLLSIPIADVPDDHCLVVDDIIDSGETLRAFEGYDIAVLYSKPYSPRIFKYSVREVSGWVSLPYEDEKKDISRSITRIIEYIGDNPRREGLLETPNRVLRFLDEFFRVPEPKIKVFNENFNGVVVDDNIRFYSLCEHHMIPFFGVASVAYIPNGRIVGLSKISRIVRFFSHRLNVQERMTRDIAEYLQGILDPRGVGVVVRARHLCKEMRGVRSDSVVTTFYFTGEFKNNGNLQSLVLSTVDRAEL